MATLLSPLAFLESLAHCTAISATLRGRSSRGSAIREPSSSLSVLPHAPDIPSPSNSGWARSYAISDGVRPLMSSLHFSDERQHTVDCITGTPQYWKQVSSETCSPSPEFA